MKLEKQILVTDEGIVEPVSVRGWKDRHGKIHLNEELARMATATHSKCEICSAIYPYEGYAYKICPDCREKKDIEKYNKLPYREWDGNIPLYSDYANRYFMTADEISDYCYDEEIDSSILRLKLCEPVKYREVSEDYWDDDMYEDQGELPKALIEALETFNAIIRSIPNDAWTDSKYRTSYDCTPCQ